MAHCQLKAKAHQQLVKVKFQSNGRRATVQKRKDAAWLRQLIAAHTSYRNASQQKTDVAWFSTTFCWLTQLEHSATNRSIVVYRIANGATEGNNPFEEIIFLCTQTLLRRFAILAQNANQKKPRKKTPTKTKTQ